MSKVLAIVGPTGSGKTALAVALAKKFNGVIISADSRQVYRGLDVGTNKEGVVGKWHTQPVRIVDGISQLLVDIVNPGDRFTLHDWLQQAHYGLEPIMQAGQLPIIAGGTGLYVTALLDGYQPGGGRFAKNNQPVNFQSLILMPNVDREILYRRSPSRFERIFDALVTETEGLLNFGVSADWLDKIGLDYRYILKYIKKQLSRSEAIEQYQAASHAYIRRQLTWWRHHGQPVLVESVEEAKKAVGKFLLQEVWSA